MTTDAAASVSQEAVLGWMRRFGAEIEEHRAELVQLDTAIGDGDHGTNMERGMRKALASLDYAGPMTEAVLLGNVAMRAGKRIEWDAKKLKVTNAPEANQFIRREYRKGWESPV